MSVELASGSELGPHHDALLGFDGASPYWGGEVRLNPNGQDQVLNVGVHASTQRLWVLLQGASTTRQQGRFRPPVCSEPFVEQLTQARRAPSLQGPAVPGIVRRDR